MPYWLARHAFLVIDAGDAILLDLRADKYIGLASFQAQQLSHVVEGWPVAPVNRAEGPGSEVSSSGSLVRSLLERGLITPDERAGKDAAPVIFERPSEEIGPDTWYGNVRIQAWDLLNFSSAVLTASAWLRLRSISAAVRHVQGRKYSRHEPDPPGRDSLARLISVFARLRPYVFTSRDKCLLESLALFEFLSRQEIFPTWVFAVHSSPFAAHCWLQSGSIVLNDTLENVRNFTPIMVV